LDELLEGCKVLSTIFDEDRIVITDWKFDESFSLGEGGFVVGFRFGYVYQTVMLSVQ
jgi:hypothetical protein